MRLTTSRAFFAGDVNIFGMRLLIQIREPEGRVMIVALRAPSLAKFGEVDTVPVSENSLTVIYEEITNLYEQPHAKNIDVTHKERP